MGTMLLNKNDILYQVIYLSTNLSRKIIVRMPLQKRVNNVFYALAKSALDFHEFG